MYYVPGSKCIKFYIRTDSVEEKREAHIKMFYREGASM